MTNVRLYAWLLMSFVYIVTTEAQSSFQSNSVAFQKIKPIATTKNYWKIAFVYDTLYFQDTVRNIRRSIVAANQLSTTINNKIATYISVDRRADANLSNSYNKLHLELANLNQTFLRFEERTAEFVHINNRTKRSLLPFGGVFKFLFGTASNDDVQTLKHNVVQLKNTQKTIIHVLEHNLSILNATRESINANRDTINELISSQRTLEHEIIHMTDDLKVRITVLQDYTISFHQISLIVYQIHNLIQTASDQLDSLSNQLNMLSIGHLSPQVISPKPFRFILNEIQSNLPKHFELPSDPNFDLWDMYKMLKCTGVIIDTKLTIIINLPIINNLNKMTLYKVHNIYAPYKNDTSHSVLPNLVASYDLTHTAVLVNSENTKFALVTDREYESCTSTQANYCQITSPIYFIGSASNCLIALYMRSENDIHKFCTIITNQIQLPTAKYLYQGQWAVATTTDIKFTMLCDNANASTSDILGRSPLSIIQIPMGCSAHSTYMTLDTFETHTVTKIIHYEPIHAINVSTKILWESLEHSNFSVNISQLNKLPRISDLPIDDLMLNLQTANENTLLPDQSENAVWLYAGIAAAIFIGGII